MNVEDTHRDIIGKPGLWRALREINIEPVQLRRRRKDIANIEKPYASARTYVCNFDIVPVRIGNARVE